MASTYSSLKFEIIGTGDQSGTWGATTNENIGTAIEQAIAGMATLTSADFTANVATLTLINTNAEQDARALCLVVSPSSLSAAGTINVPAIEKPYIIINNDSYAVTVKVSGQTGVAVPAGKRTVVYNNGTDVADQVNFLTNLVLGTALPVTSGGTGSTTSTGSGAVVLANSPTLVTPALGTPSSATLTNATGLPVTTGISGLGSNVATALAATANSSTGLVTGGGTATLTAKRIDLRVSTAASTSTLTPDISAFDQYNLTAQAAPLTIAAPIGTPVDGNRLIIRLFDNGTARAITWNGTYTAIGVTLPASTTTGKTIYVGCLYNASATRWDVVAVATQA
jgi:hypothetical protein